MFIRYAKTFFGIIIYILFFSLALIPLFVIRPNIENTHYSIAVTIWAVGTAIFFLPALAIIIKRIWFFEGKGEPIPLEQLKTILLEINDFGGPIYIKEKRNKLKASWKHQEQSWCELFENVRMKRIYELWMAFDRNTRTVIMTDKYRSADWKLSPIKVKTGWLAYPKPYFNVTVGEKWGIDNYVDSTPEDYNFTPKEIKSPILNTVLKNGWNVRFSLF